MSNEIFKWQPHLLDFDSSVRFNTIRSTFENGVVQRRNLFPREIRKWKFNFHAGVFSPTDRKKIQDEILSFFIARKGSYENFWLPSWELEAEITGQTTNQITLAESPTALGFSATSGEGGNYIYICDRYCTGFGRSTITHEIRRITLISGSGPYTITLDASCTNSYSAGAKVQKAFKVYFENDELVRGFKCPYIWESPLEFVEDVADAYSTTFGF